MYYSVIILLCLTSGKGMHKSSLGIIPKCELIQDYKNLYDRKDFLYFYICPNYLQLFILGGITDLLI